MPEAALGCFQSGLLPSWLLIVATGAICVGTLKLESADLFPVWRFAVQWSPEALPSSRAVPMTEIASGRARPVAYRCRTRISTIQPGASFRTS